MTLEVRLRSRLAPLRAVEKHMFGGTCFMIDGNMLVGTLKNVLIVRVGKDAHDTALKMPDARAFDITGRAMKGFVMVEGPSLSSEAALDVWVDMALAFVRSLPPKVAGPVKIPRGRAQRGRAR